MGQREYTPEEEAQLEANLGVTVENVWVVRVLAMIAGTMVLSFFIWAGITMFQKNEQREQEKLAVQAQVAEVVESVEANIEAGASVVEAVAAVGGDATIRVESFQNGEEFFVYAERIASGRAGNYAYINYGYNSIIDEFVHGTYNEVNYAHVPHPEDE